MGFLLQDWQGGSAGKKMKISVYHRASRFMQDRFADLLLLACGGVITFALLAARRAHRRH